MGILDSVADWKVDEIRELLTRQDLRQIDVPWLIVELDKARETLRICKLYAKLVEEFGEHQTAAFFRHVFNADPSRGGTQFVAVGELFGEKPFPRYIVALCYLMLMDCIEHRCQELEEDVWANILNAKHRFWPELLVDILLRVSSEQRVFEQAVTLQSAADPRMKTIGRDIDYGMRARHLKG